MPSRRGISAVLGLAFLLVSAVLGVGVAPADSGRAAPAPADGSATAKPKPPPCKKLKRKPARCRKKPATAKRRPVPCNKVKVKPARCRKATPQQPRPRQPRPLNVSVSVDSARAVSAEIPPAGGSASATAADGSRYTLTIPPGALLDRVTVKLTPIGSVPGLPLSGGFVAGVHLEPEGLRLVQPATLLVEPKTSVPDGRRTGFAYYDLGRELHLYPISGNASSATFSITHFSGYGVGDGTQADRSAHNAAHPPTDPVDQARQQTAAGAIPSAAHEASLLAPYFVLLAQLRDPNAVDAAVATFVAWKALAQPFAAMYPGLGARLLAMERNDFPAAMRQHVAHYRRQCAALKDLTQVRQMLRIAGYAADLPSLGALRPDVDAALNACVRFELDFELTLDEQAVIEPASATVRVDGLRLTARLGAFPFVMDLSGEKDLTVVRYTVAPADCWTHTWVVSPTKPLVVRSLSFDLNLHGGAASAATLRVIVDPGALNESITHVCSGDASSAYTDERTTYERCFSLVHPTGVVGPSQYIGAAVWARGTMSASGGDCTATTTFELRHTPVP